jgi:dCTP deaminase
MAGLGERYYSWRIKQMVLTDREIQSAIANGQIKVEPTPTDPAVYSSTSLDLTLSKSIRVWKKPKDMPGVDPVVVSPGVRGYKYSEFASEYSDLTEIGNDGYVLHPGSFLLGRTAESIELFPHSRIAARVEGKSSLARLGIGVHITAPTIHAGFKGTIELEMFNHGVLRVRLIPRMLVCQLIFEQTLGTPEKGYRGQFFGQGQT